MLKPLLVAAIAVSGILFPGCNSTPTPPCLANRTMEAKAYRSPAGLPDGDRYLTSAPAGTAAKAYDPVDDPMITLSAQLELAAPEVGKVQLELMSLARQYNGYLLSSTPEETTLRVEQGKFIEAVSAAEKLGKLLDKRIYGQSQEEQFKASLDTLQQLEETRTRLANELRKSDHPSERLALERQLQNTEQRLLALKGTHAGIKRTVHYATITVIHHKKEMMGPVTALFWSAGKALRWLFVID